MKKTKCTCFIWFIVGVVLSMYSIDYLEGDTASHTGKFYSLWHGTFICKPYEEKNND